jgi:hypothetical protein
MGSLGAFQGMPPRPIPPNGNIPHFFGRVLESGAISAAAPWLPTSGPTVSTASGSVQVALVLLKEIEVGELSVPDEPN